MKKFVAAAIAALAVAVVTSVALAGIPTAKVKAVGSNYVISGKAKLAKDANVVDVEIFQHGTTISGSFKYSPPTAKNHGRWKVTAAKSGLPAGRYRLEWVEIIPNSKPHYLKYKFTIKP